MPKDKDGKITEANEKKEEIIAKLLFIYKTLQSTGRSRSDSSEYSEMMDVFENMLGNIQSSADLTQINGYVKNISDKAKDYYFAKVAQSHNAKRSIRFTEASKLVYFNRPLMSEKEMLMRTLAIKAAKAHMIGSELKYAGFEQSKDVKDLNNWLLEIRAAQTYNFDKFQDLYKNKTEKELKKLITKDGKALALSPYSAEEAENSNKEYPKDSLERVKKVNELAAESLSGDFYKIWHSEEEMQQIKKMTHVLGIDCSRSGLQQIVVGRMLIAGYSIEEIMDPGKHREVRERIAELTMNKFRQACSAYDKSDEQLPSRQEILDDLGFFTAEAYYKGITAIRDYVQEKGNSIRSYSDMLRPENKYFKGAVQMYLEAGQDMVKGQIFSDYLPKISGMTCEKIQSELKDVTDAVTVNLGLYVNVGEMLNDLLNGSQSIEINSILDKIGVNYLMQSDNPEKNPLLDTNCEIAEMRQALTEILDQDRKHNDLYRSVIKTQRGRERLVSFLASDGMDGKLFSFDENDELQFNAEVFNEEMQKILDEPALLQNRQQKLKESIEYEHYQLTLVLDNIERLNKEKEKLADNADLSKQEKTRRMADINKSLSSSNKIVLRSCARILANENIQEKLNSEGEKLVSDEILNLASDEAIETYRKKLQKNDILKGLVTGTSLRRLRALSIKENGAFKTEKFAEELFKEFRKEVSSSENLKLETEYSEADVLSYDPSVDDRKIASNDQRKRELNRLKKKYGSLTEDEKSELNELTLENRALKDEMSKKLTKRSDVARDLDKALEQKNEYLTKLIASSSMLTDISDHINEYAAGREKTEALLDKIRTYLEKNGNKLEKNVRSAAKVPYNAEDVLMQCYLLNREKTEHKALEHGEKFDSYEEYAKEITFRAQKMLNDFKPSQIREDYQRIKDNKDLSTERLSVSDNPEINLSALDTIHKEASQYMEAMRAKVYDVFASDNELSMEMKQRGMAMILTCNMCIIPPKSVSDVDPEAVILQELLSEQFLENGRRNVQKNNVFENWATKVMVSNTFEKAFSSEEVLDKTLSALLKNKDKSEAFKEERALLDTVFQPRTLLANKSKIFEVENAVAK